MDALGRAPRVWVRPRRGGWVGPDRSDPAGAGRDPHAVHLRPGRPVPSAEGPARGLPRRRARNGGGWDRDRPRGSVPGRRDPVGAGPVRRHADPSHAGIAPAAAGEHAGGADGRQRDRVVHHGRLHPGGADVGRSAHGRLRPEHDPDRGGRAPRRRRADDRVRLSRLRRGRRTGRARRPAGRLPTGRPQPRRRARPAPAGSSGDHVGRGRRADRGARDRPARPRAVGGGPAGCGRRDGRCDRRSRDDLARRQEPAHARVLVRRRAVGSRSSRSRSCWRPFR